MGFKLQFHYLPFYTVRPTAEILIGTPKGMGWLHRHSLEAVTHFPPISLLNSESPPETSSPPTPHTAIESAWVETFPRYANLDRENPAVSRGH
jgi:hypothetical protein